MEEKKTANYPSVFDYPQYCTPVGIAAGEASRKKHKGGAKRFVGVDLSKQNCHICIIDRQGMIVLHNWYSLRSTQRGKLYEILEEGDLVLMEASTGNFNIARAMNKIPGVVACVVNLRSTPINLTKKKTDKEDSLFLARLLLRTPVERLQLVSIPSDQEMASRDTISHYRKIDESHTQLVNRLHALFFE